VRVRWTADASGCLLGIANLRRFPLRGRLGLAPGTREIVYPPWPYIAVYEISGDQVHVLGIRHASQDWP